MSFTVIAVVYLSWLFLVVSAETIQVELQYKTNGNEITLNCTATDVPKAEKKIHIYLWHRNDKNRFHTVASNLMATPNTCVAYTLDNGVKSSCTTFQSSMELKLFNAGDSYFSTYYCGVQQGVGPVLYYNNTNVIKDKLYVVPSSVSTPTYTIEQGAEKQVGENIVKDIQIQILPTQRNYQLGDQLQINVTVRANLSLIYERNTGIFNCFINARSGFNPFFNNYGGRKAQVLKPNNRCFAMDIYSYDDAIGKDLTCIVFNIPSLQSCHNGTVQCELELNIHGSLKITEAEINIINSTKSECDCDGPTTGQTSPTTGPVSLASMFRVSLASITLPLWLLINYL